MSPSEPVYTIEITETQRSALACALGLLVSKLTDAPLQITQKSPQDAPSTPNTPTPAVAPVPTSPQTRDRWAHGRDGQEQPFPTGCYTVNVHIFKAERADSNGKPRMKVAFESPTGRGTTDAACWDDRLFPFLAVASKETKATLHIIQAKKGQKTYLNIVGVRG